MNTKSMHVVASRKLLLMSSAIALAGGMLVSTAASANDDLDAVECSARTLRGVFQFRASGHNIVNGAALPKAIIETLIFDGRGNVSTPEISLSANGFIIQPPQGSPGIYTVDVDCTGTLTFGDGIMFDLQVNPNGRSVNMLQTNPNTVMQGAAEKVLSFSSWRG